MTTVGRPELATHNHMALDQLMDLRNDTMKIVYGFGGVTKEGFPAALAKDSLIYSDACITFEYTPVRHRVL